MTIPRSSQRARLRSFTLVELLVAVGLTALLLWGILQLYASATQFSSTMFTQAELVAGGRAVLDRMCHELASSSTLEVGYLKITNNESGFDIIQFVAPVGDDNELTHVRYDVETATGYLRRSTKPAEDNVIPTDYGSNVKPLGVTVQRFNVSYIDVGSASGDPLETSNEWRDDNPDDANVPRLPRAVLIEIRVADVKRKVGIVLSSGAFLGGSGI